MIRYNHASPLSTTILHSPQLVVSRPLRRPALCLSSLLSYLASYRLPLRIYKPKCIIRSLSVVKIALNESFAIFRLLECRKHAKEKRGIHKCLKPTTINLEGNK